MIEFGKVLGVTVSGNSRATTLQIAATGQEGDDDAAERIDAVEVLQPAGLMAAPSLSATAEAAFIRLGDEVVALALIDKGASSQSVEAGEVRLYGPGSSNASAVVRIRANGSIEITPLGGVNVVLAGGSLSVARATDPVGAGATMAAWIAAVSALLNNPGPVIGAPGAVVPPVDFGTVTSGATQVKA
jgi:hypothetical protein